VADKPIPWTERRLVIRSHPRAHAGERARRARLANAQAAMAARNERRRGKRRVPELPALRAAVAAIVARDHVQGLRSRSDEEPRRQWPVRRDGDRPAMGRVEQDWHVTAHVDPEAVEVAVRQPGWRVSATQQPPAQLSLGQAVLAYRNEDRIERDMGRLKGRPLSLAPMSLERDDHATGLSRLLSSGLRGLTLLECVVRQRLAAAQTRWVGLSAGNPKRTTAGPTAERLLESFQAWTLTIIRAGRRRR
jgi:transposase